MSAPGSVWAVVLAAGASARMLGQDKIMHPLGGKPVLRWALEAFEHCDAVQGICLVLPPARSGQPDATIAGWNLTKLRVIADGGAHRGQSVLNGLRALPPGVEIVAVHDAARPFVSEPVITASIEVARQYGAGVAAIPCTDTIKQCDAHGRVLHTPARDTLAAVQTPQTFGYAALLAAYERAQAQNAVFTDDAAVMEWAGHSVHLVPGDAANRKLTTPLDLHIAQAMLAATTRVGQGYDVHRLVADRPLMLGCIHIPHEQGLAGHSDADVLAHAVIDALLGAAALDDIGRHFPDTQEAYRGISGQALLERTRDILRRKCWHIRNVDAVIVAQRPRLAPYTHRMRAKIAAALACGEENINIKAKSTEGLGFEGEGLGISAQAVAMLCRV